jgi:hypothetical protein
MASAGSVCFSLPAHSPVLAQGKICSRSQQASTTPLRTASALSDPPMHTHPRQHQLGTIVKGVPKSKEEEEKKQEEEQRIRDISGRLYGAGL